MITRKFKHEPEYDRLSETIARQVCRTIETTDNLETTFDFEEPLEFTLILTVNRTTTFNAKRTIEFKNLPWESLNFKNKGFAINSKSYVPEDAVPEIEVIVHVSDTLGPQGYSILYYKLIDDIRHEIEHLLQQGINKSPTHAVRVNQSTRDKAQSNYKYFLMANEIPAMVSGMHASSSARETPIDSEFEEYLIPFLEYSIINKQQFLKIMKSWLDFAKQTYPKLRTTNKYF